MWEQNCGTAYVSPSMPNLGSMCSASLAPVDLPATFNMSSLVQSGQGGTVFTYDFGVVLTAHELVGVSMSSTAPVDLRIYLDNRTGYDVRALGNEALYYGNLITNSTGITSYNDYLLAESGGLYIFELSVSQPLPIARATFDIQQLTNQA